MGLAPTSTAASLAAPFPPVLHRLSTPELAWRTTAGCCSPAPRHFNSQRARLALPRLCTRRKSAVPSPAVRVAVQQRVQPHSGWTGRVSRGSKLQPRTDGNRARVSDSSGTAASTSSFRSGDAVVQDQLMLVLDDADRLNPEFDHAPGACPSRTPAGIPARRWTEHLLFMQGSLPPCSSRHPVDLVDLATRIRSIRSCTASIVPIVSAPAASSSPLAAVPPAPPATGKAPGRRIRVSGCRLCRRELRILSNSRFTCRRRCRLCRQPPSPKAEASS